MSAARFSHALTAVAFLCAASATADAQGCDQLAGKLLSTYLDPAIKGLGCSELERAGLDNADHKLESVCYTSTGPMSSIQIVASLHCHTSDSAFIKASVSERVTADAEVRGSDCTVQKTSVRASGEIGKILAKALDAEGRARTALQEGLTKLCSGNR